MISRASSHLPPQGGFLITKADFRRAPIRTEGHGLKAFFSRTRRGTRDISELRGKSCKLHHRRFRNSLNGIATLAFAEYAALALRWSNLQTYPPFLSHLRSATTDERCDRTVRNVTKRCDCLRPRSAPVKNPIVPAAVGWPTAVPFDGQWRRYLVRRRKSRRIRFILLRGLLWRSRPRCTIVLFSEVGFTGE